MNNSQVLNSMQQRLGNRRNFAKETLLVELNAKIAELEAGPFLPWFLEGMWEAVITANVQSLNLPADFLHEVEDGKLELVSVTGRFLYPKKRPFELLQRIWQNYPDGGEPHVYALWGGQLHIAPRPQFAYELSMPYFKKTPEVEDNEDAVTSWLKHAYNFIVYDTLVDVSANHLKDKEGAANFASLGSEAYAKLYKFNEARQHTNADYNIGEDS